MKQCSEFTVLVHKKTKTFFLLVDYKLNVDKGSN